VNSQRIVHSLFTEEFLPLDSPKKLTVSACSVDKAMDLNQLWHSLLPNTNKSNLIRNKYSVCYAAYFNNIYYGVAIWTSPVARSLPQNILELRRLALSEDCPKNSASYFIGKMTKKIKKDFKEVKKLISYQDMSKHCGTIYKASNWYIDGHVLGNRDWSDSRKRNKTQTKANKIRWSYDLEGK